MVATITLHPGETVTLITAMHTSRDAAAVATGEPYPPGAFFSRLSHASPTSFSRCAHVVPPPAPWKQHDPLPLTLSYIRGLDHTKVAQLRAGSATWWAEFWARSAIDIPSEPMIEYFWNAAQYVLGSASRPGKVVPSLFGPWVTNDFPQWYGDMTMDYNQQSAFYHVASSNHAEQAQSEIQAIAAYLPAARKDAISLLAAYNRTCEPGKTGVSFPSHISPYGFRKFNQAVRRCL